MNKIWLILVSLLVAGAVASADQPDPYSILDQHVKTMGGWPALDAVRSSHSKATLVIEGAGIEGTVEDWAQLPDRSRQELDLKVITEVSGDNGQVAWRVDQNGKLQMTRDPATLKERQLGALMAAREHLKRGSAIFTVTFDRMDTVDGVSCYVIKTTNTINSFVLYDYYDTVKYLPLKSVVIKPDGETHTTNHDFREVNKTLAPFLMRQLELPTGQRVTVKLELFEVNQPLDPLLFEPPAQQPADYHFPAGKNVVEAPFKFIESHIYLPLTINGKTRLWVLDTGAEWTVVDTAFARELGLELTGEMIGQGATSTVGVSFSTLPSFELNGLVFDSQNVAAIGVNELFRKTMGFEIGGILGYDFLSRVVSRIDFAHQLLTLYEPASFEYHGGGVVLDVPLAKNNMFQVEITIDGQYSGNWSVDLGATGLDFLYPYAESHGLLGRRGVARMGFGAGGGQLTTMARFAKIEFAGFTVPDLVAGIPSARGEGAFSRTEMTGNAGNELFCHFVLYLDYAREKMIVEKGDDFDRVFPYDHSGLQLMYDDNQQATVLLAAPGTPAAEAGLREGDQVTAVNGRSVAALGGLVKFRELLKEPAGTTVQLEIVRDDGKPLAITFTLRDLFSDSVSL